MIAVGHGWAPRFKVPEAVADIRSAVCHVRLVEHELAENRGAERDVFERIVSTATAADPIELQLGPAFAYWHVARLAFRLPRRRPLWNQRLWYLLNFAYHGHTNFGIAAAARRSMAA